MPIMGLGAVLGLPTRRSAFVTQPSVRGRMRSSLDSAHPEASSGRLDAAIAGLCQRSRARLCDVTFLDDAGPHLSRKAARDGCGNAPQATTYGPMCGRITEESDGPAA